MNPNLSAKNINNKHRENEMVGAIIHIRKNFFTSVFLKIFFGPSLATPIPRIAATFNCTNDVGMPFVTEASKSKEAETKAIIPASNFPNKTISLPVLFRILSPKIELPIAKLGATISVEIIITSIKFLSP